jgi:nuclear pore complex protein Nup107
LAAPADLIPERMQLNAARALLNRAPCRGLVREKLGVSVRSAEEDPGPDWIEDFDSTEIPDEILREYKTDRTELSTSVRNLWELECLVKALDVMETLSSYAQLSREYGSHPQRLNPMVHD